MQLINISSLIRLYHICQSVEFEKLLFSNIFQDCFTAGVKEAIIIPGIDIIHSLLCFNDLKGKVMSGE